MTASSLRIGVIGGGIGGLIAAVALRKAGFDVDLYEQAPGLTEIGGGINMGPNAVRVLSRLGLGAGLDREGVQPIGTRGFIELFPGFADTVFDRGPQGLAMLTSTVGLGAIAGGTWMLIRSQIAGLTRVVLANTLLMSLAIVAFTATSNFVLALPCVFVAGMAMVITGIGAQTLIQASVDHRMSGRVMALYGMIFRAGPALGAVAMGTASTYLGLRLPLAVGAALSIGFLGLALTRRRMIAVALESPSAAVDVDGSTGIERRA